MATIRNLFFKGIFLTWTGLSVALSSSCAYKFKATQRQLPGGYQSVAVPIFKNKTHETGIEVAFTNALIQQFHKSQTVHVAEANLADLKAIGIIEQVSYEPQGKKQNGDSGVYLPKGTALASGYRVVVTVLVQLVRQSDQQVLWSSSIHGESSYSAPLVTLATVNTVNPLYNLSARRQTVDALAQDLMTEAHNLMTESF